MSETSEMDISIVVPVYNSHDTLDALMARVETALSQITARFDSGERWQP